MATLLNETRSFEAALRLVRSTVAPNPQAKHQRRILIVDSGSLVEAGVEALLRREIDLVVNVCPFIGESAFTRTVANFRPDVIIVNEAGEVTAERVLELLAGRLTTLRLIVVRSHDDALEVYEYRRAAASEVGDLLSLIRSGSSPRA